MNNEDYTLIIARILHELYVEWLLGIFARTREEIAVPFGALPQERKDYYLHWAKTIIKKLPPFRD